VGYHEATLQYENNCRQKHKYADNINQYVSEECAGSKYGTI
jgi:hypothetical protein